MNKEQQELLDEAYKTFEKWYNEHSGKEDYTGYYVPDKKEFIRIIKMNNQFSEKWGLKIEERELSLEERIKVGGLKYNHNPSDNGYTENDEHRALDVINIPTKLIKITYKDKTITSYE
jgi:hypothetical protein